MVVLLLAVLAAAFNAVASVLQRQAAAKATGSLLLLRLARRPVWLAGVGALIVGFILHATALSRGDLVVVQPILVTELPFSLLMAALVAGLRPGIRDWMASAEMSVGLSLVLVASAPSGAITTPRSCAGLYTFGRVFRLGFGGLRVGSTVSLMGEEVLPYGSCWWSVAG